MSNSKWLSCSPRQCIALMSNAKNGPFTCFDNRKTKLLVFQCLRSSYFFQQVQLLDTFPGVQLSIVQQLIRPAVQHPFSFPCHKSSSRVAPGKPSRRHRAPITPSIPPCHSALTATAAATTSPPEPTAGLLSPSAPGAGQNNVQHQPIHASRDHLGAVARPAGFGATLGFRRNAPSRGSARKKSRAPSTTRRLRRGRPTIDSPARWTEKAAMVL